MAKKKTRKKTTKKTTKKSSGSKPLRSTIKTEKPAETSPAKTTPEVVPMPTAGRKVTEFEDQLDASLKTADDTLKRGRGRPRKEAEQPPPEIDVKVIGQALQIPFDLWAMKNDCDGLKLSLDEAVLMARPAKQLIDHYIPQVPEIGWAWLSLTAVSYSIIKTRLVLIAEIKKQKSTSSEQTMGAKESPERRDHGRSQSSAFPTIESIKNPVT